MVTAKKVHSLNKQMKCLFLSINDIILEESLISLVNLNEGLVALVLKSSEIKRENVHENHIMSSAK